jgi:hypothetical protein
LVLTVAFGLLLILIAFLLILTLLVGLRALLVFHCFFSFDFYGMELPRALRTRALRLGFPNIF